jgi:hypothetical protein
LPNDFARQKIADFPTDFAAAQPPLAGDETPDRLRGLGTLTAFLARSWPALPWSGMVCRHWIVES